MTRVKVTLEWDQLDLASVELPLDMLDVVKWNKSFVRLKPAQDRPKDLTIPVWDHTLIGIRFEAIR